LAEEQVDAVAAAASEARETLLGEHRAECAALKAEVEGYRQRGMQLKEHAEEVAAKQRQTRSEYEDYMARTQSASDIVVGLQRQLRLAEEKLVR
jgi:chromosome segregation ATPase